MRIKNIELQTNRPHSEDVVVIEDDNGNTYTLLDSEIEKLLEDSGQICGHCGGTGEVTVDEQVYPGEPHMAPIGTRTCVCKTSSSN